MLRSKTRGTQCLQPKSLSWSNSGLILNSRKDGGARLSEEIVRSPCGNMLVCDSSRSDTNSEE